MKIALLFIAISASSLGNLILHLDKGIVLEDDGWINTINSIASIPLIYKFVTNEFIEGPELCDTNQSASTYYIQEIQKLFPRRQPRFLGLAGVIGSVVSGGLAIINHHDITKLQSTMVELVQEQGRISGGFETLAQEQERLSKSHHNTVLRLNKLSKEFEHFIGATECNVHNLHSLIPFAIEADHTLNDAKFLISHIKRKEFTPEVIRKLLPLHKIKSSLTLSQQGKLPDRRDLYKLIKVLPGKLDGRTLTFSCIAIVPLQEPIRSKKYRILNTGYIKDNVHRVCPFYGIVGLIKQEFNMIHLEVCEKGSDGLYCPPYALAPDTRGEWLKGSDCPPGQKIQMPFTQFSRYGILAVSNVGFNVHHQVSEGKISNGYMMPPNGVLWVNYSRLQTLLSGKHVIYASTQLILNEHNHHVVHSLNFSNFIYEKLPELETSEHSHIQWPTNKYIYIGTTGSIYVWLSILTIAQCVMMYLNWASYRRH